MPVIARQILLSICLICALSVGKPIDIAVFNANRDPSIKQGIAAFQQSQPEFENFYRIHHYDNSGDAEKTLIVMKEIKDRGIRIVIGLSSSDEAIAAANFAESNGMLFLTPLATHNEIGKNKSSTFLISYNDTIQASGLARFSISLLQKTKILLVKDSTSLTSLGMTEAMELALSKLAPKRLNVIVHTTSGKELNLPQLETLIQNQKPQLIFFGEGNSQSPELIRIIRKHQSKAIFLGGAQFGTHPNIKGIAQSLPPSSIYYAAPWHSELTSKYNEFFLSIWKTLYPKSEPSLNAVMFFESLQIFYGASRIAKHPKNSLELVRVLKKMNFPSTNGPLKFPSYTNYSAPRDVQILTFEGSKIKPLKTVRLKWNPNP